MKASIKGGLILLSIFLVFEIIHRILLLFSELAMITMIIEVWFFAFPLLIVLGHETFLELFYVEVSGFLGGGHLNIFGVIIIGIFWFTIGIIIGKIKSKRLSTPQ